MYFQKIGEGAPILFLHGWGCDGSIFLPVAKMLTNNCCYLLDFAGFGKSQKPPACGWSVLDYANDVVEFLQTQKLSRVTIVAHSFGCRVALVLASKYPLCVDKMLLFAPAGLRRFSLRRWLKVAKYKLKRFATALSGSQNAVGRFGSADYLACADGMKNTFVKVVNQDLSFYAKKITHPTLIVNGSEDIATPLKQARRLRKLIKNSCLTVVDGGHFALFERPRAFANTIKFFEGDL